MHLTDLPLLNAILNTLATLFLIAGYLMIRRRRLQEHRFLMLAAFTCSVAFLGSYLLYHFQVGSVRFQGTGWLRTVYLSILATHTVLATAVPFLAGVTLFRAFREEFQKHRKLARWTLPIWLYVSVTGVVIYWMLYQLEL